MPEEQRRAALPIRAFVEGKEGGKHELFPIFFNNISPADTSLFVAITVPTQLLNWIWVGLQDPPPAPTRRAAGSPSWAPSQPHLQGITFP